MTDFKISIFGVHDGKDTTLDVQQFGGTVPNVGDYVDLSFGNPQKVDRRIFLPGDNSVSLHLLPIE